MAQQKTMTFQILQNTGYKQKRFVATPLLTKIGVFQLVFFLKPTTLMLNKNITENQDKKDKKKGFPRENKTGNPPKKRLDEKNTIESFDAVPFMREKGRRQKKERTREKQGTKTKQKRKTRRKNERKEQERDRERETEKGGGQKGLRRNKGRHSKTKKCPFWGEKQVFY